MSWSQAGGKGRPSLARRSGRPAVLFVAIVAAVLMAPRPAAAHPQVLCPETYNPAHNPPPDKFTGVPGGWSTAPGTTNPSTPINPDGFFAPVTDSHGFTVRDGCPGFGGLSTGNGTGELFINPDTGTTVFPQGTTIKYTEANGVTEPKADFMAANQDGGNGLATFIDFHLWGAGDMWVCDAVDTVNCACCWVPPPPFTCVEGLPCPEAE